MRNIIAALQVSLDGFIEGATGELDWIDTWEDPFGILPRIDLCLLGGGMYPGYEQYWSAILADPNSVLPFTGKVATEGEVEYAAFARDTPHLVLSRTLNQVAWRNTRIARDIEAVRQVKQAHGKDIHAVGGAALVGSLLNHGLVDELLVVVHPILLGGGKALFKDVTARHRLTLAETHPLPGGAVRLAYRVGAT